MIVFRALNQEHIKAIVSLELAKVSERLKENEITLAPTEEAIDLLADLGYEREYGARPLKRIIQQKVEDALSDALLSGEIEDGDTVVIDTEMGDENPDIVLRRDEGETVAEPA